MAAGARDGVLGHGVLGKGATVTPRLTLGVRHDGGDAETGFGADIGGGVTLAAPAEGLTVSLDGRGVLTHEAAGLRDRGIAGTLAWNPPSSPGRGPKLTLSQTFGAGAASGKDALLSRTTLEGLAAHDNGAGQRRLRRGSATGSGCSGAGSPARRRSASAFRVRGATTAWAGASPAPGPWSCPSMRRGATARTATPRPSTASGPP